MHTDKSEDTGMSLHVRSAGSFHGFGVASKGHEKLLRKVFGGHSLPLGPPYGFTVLFMVSGMSREGREQYVLTNSGPWLYWLILND